MRGKAGLTLVCEVKLFIFGRGNASWGLDKAFLLRLLRVYRRRFAGSGFEGEHRGARGEITVLSFRRPRWIRAAGESILQGLKPFFDAAWEGQA
jgi:hypothetical protein